MLNPHAALLDEGRALLGQELREPKVYFALLQALADGDKAVGELASAIRSDAQRCTRYLETLRAMRLAQRRVPVGASSVSRTGHWHLRDPFLRFWFRFVFPHQDDLKAGLHPRTLFEIEIAPDLADHVAPEFEEYCRSWVRASRSVSTVGPWWGRALDELRRNGSRTTEEIDIVGLARGRVAVIGECRWRNSPMDVRYLSDIETYKLPALRQSGLRVASSPSILMFSRGGFTPALRSAAAERSDIELYDAAILEWARSPCGWRCRRVVTCVMCARAAVGAVAAMRRPHGARGPAPAGDTAPRACSTTQHTAPPCRGEKSE